jgi:hypothetical protein
MADIGGNEVGSALVDALAGQADLLSSLSLAVIGGLFAFAIQVMVHNSAQPKNKIRLSSLWTWWCALALEAVSIGASYLLKGSVVAAIPTIFGSKYLVGSPLAGGTMPALDMLRLLALCQFATFALGVLILMLFLVFNRRLLGG